MLVIASNCKYGSTCCDAPIPEMEAINQSRSTDFASAWVRSGAILCFCLSITLFLYWPTVTEMLALWRTSTFSHGFLIVPISLYTIWRRRERLRLLSPAPTFLAIPVLILLCLGWFLAHLAAADVVEQFCLVATVIVLIWGTLGNNVARAMLMPLVFLLFAVPFGEALVPSLQDFSAWFAVKMLDLCNIPVLLEGRFISVPSGKWEVAEACSGLRFLTSSLPVGFLFAGLMYRKWVRRIGFFVVSAVVPILANAVRVFGIVLLAYVSGNRIATGVDHIVYGWIFFAAVMAVLLAVGGWWREGPNKQTDAASLPAVEAHENKGSKADGRRSMTATIVFACCSVAAISIAPVSIKFLWVPTAQSPRFDLISPVASLPVRSDTAHEIGWKPEFLTPNAELTQSYEIQNQPIELYVAYYSADQPDAKLVSSTNALFDKRRWLRTNEDDAEAEVEGKKFRVHETLIRSTERSLVVWSLYWVDGKYTSSEIAAKLLWVKARFLRDRRGAAIIAIAAEDRPGHIPAAEILRQFLEHISLRRTLASKAG